MKINFTFKSFLCIALFAGTGSTQAQETTFDFTGAVQTYTVPLGVTSIQIEVWGAQGGSGVGFDGVPATGGLGGYSIGNLEVVPGQVLNVYVGGAGALYGIGGFNGGGQAGTEYGASGGGASDVRIGAYTLFDRVIVGGGGGGGAFGSYGSYGGEGGGLTGGMGLSHYGDIAGSGGTQVAGGAAGCCYGAATAGVFGAGGGPGDYHNAGGGGGWYGGGSGAAQAGAGGGSSYIGGVAAGFTTPGLRAGNGQVIITVLCSPMTLFVSDYEICLGESVTMDADGAGTISWTGGVVNGVPYTPASTGTFTYNATSSSPTDCGLTVEILVNELPNVTASVDETEICLGESVIFSNSGADTYTWDPADVTAGDPYSPTEGTATYVVTGINTATGCENTAEVEVTVYEELTITFTTVDEMAGADGEIDITVTGGNPAYSFDWDNDGTGDFDDTEDLTGLAGGTYVVVIEDEAGCSATETIVLNSQLGIEINVENNISIYPNPTTAHITILAAGSFTYEITDVNGQIVLVANGVDTEEVSLEELASGIYFVNLTIADELTTIRIVKN